ncbi:T9SS type A sorting domain-containing protein [Thermaurantimonas aggregans]|uniref:T9SS type A sorting domain-containing protein n=1 Tax=Thermaurantimonas aggregans TaxID=2173829 RepID=UPI0023F173F3|nr:T9SS type A sorting domain-containing protein [Thermaurantimonas aggregans]MCX8148937.1 T9SS type A sorting domain-containing protein [Thermaurantimonas aggregans]
MKTTTTPAHQLTSSPAHQLTSSPAHRKLAKVITLWAMRLSVCISSLTLTAQYAVIPASNGSNVVGSACGSSANFIILNHNPFIGAVISVTPVGFTIGGFNFNTTNGSLELTGVTITNPGLSNNNLYSFEVDYFDPITWIIYHLTGHIAECCNPSSGATFALVHHTVSQSGIMPPGTYVGEVIDVYGDVTLDGDYYFQNCIFNMASDARLILTSGPNFFFDQCHVRSCDGNNRWDAIHMDNSDIEVHIFDSHIEHGIRGIWIEGGGVAYIQKNHFSNNVISLTTQDYNGSPSDILFSDNLIDIYQEGFSGVAMHQNSAVNLTPYSFINPQLAVYHQGVAIVHSKNVHIGYPGMGVNHFQVLANTENPIIYITDNSENIHLLNNELYRGNIGVAARESDIHIGSAIGPNVFFDQAMYGIFTDSSSHNIHYNTFTTGETAMFLRNIRYIPEHQITHNEISDYFTGLKVSTNLQHYTRMLVHYNTMNTVKTRGIDIIGLLSDPNWTQDKRLHINYNTIIGDNSFTTFDGIKLTETENAIIGDNHIEHLASVNDCDMNAYYGIHLHRALNTWVSSNTLENLCYGLYGSDNLLFTRIECNDFITTSGIYFDQVNIGNIGSPGQTANNRWINNNGFTKIRGSLMNSNPIILYYWNSSQGGDYDPNHNISPPNSFDDISNATLYSCISAPAYRPLDQVEFSSFDLAVYPNPFSDALHMSFSDAKKTDFELYIYNSLGQVVYRTSGSVLEQNTTLHLSHLPAGIYILALKANDDTKSIKLVKN